MGLQGGLEFNSFGKLAVGRSLTVARTLVLAWRLECSFSRQKKMHFFVYS